MLINGVEVAGDYPPDELAKYVAYVKERVPNVVSISVQPAEDDFVDISYTAQFQPFERIRRITGYLAGTIDRWNNAKRAEERDRVKHV